MDELKISENQNDSRVEENLQDEAIEASNNIAFGVNAYGSFDKNPQDNQKIHEIDGNNVLDITMIVQDVILT